MNTTSNKTEHVKTIRELLGMEEAEFIMPENVSQASPEPPPFVLPVAEILSVLPEIPAPAEPMVSVYAPEMAAKSKFAQILSHDWVRYPLIFLVALGFFFAVLNFRSLSDQFLGYINPPEKNDEVALGDEAIKFNSWISRYYVYAGSQDQIAPGADPDFDGLTNIDEFWIWTNPLRTDTDRDNSDDGREILFSTNPLYDGAMLGFQRALVADHLDMDAVAMRRDYQYGQISGESTEDDAFVVDVSVSGEILIPRLKITAPIIWSFAFEDMEDDLKEGVAHHPDTPFPGESGTVSIHGHSSGNLGDGDFQTVFTKINLLEPGDEVFITVYSEEGSVRKYRYLVRSEKVYSKTDPAQFDAGDGYFLNLSTSWPIGTALQRYVVTTELAGL